MCPLPIRWLETRAHGISKVVIHQTHRPSPCIGDECKGCILSEDAMTIMLPMLGHMFTTVVMPLDVQLLINGGLLGPPLQSSSHQMSAIWHDYFSSPLSLTLTGNNMLQTLMAGIAIPQYCDKQQIHAKPTAGQKGGKSMCVRACVCARVCACVCVCACAIACTCACTCAFAHARACARACACVCLRVQLRVCARERVRVMQCSDISAEQSIASWPLTAIKPPCICWVSIIRLRAAVYAGTDHNLTLLRDPALVCQLASKVKALSLRNVSKKLTATVTASLCGFSHLTSLELHTRNGPTWLPDVSGILSLCNLARISIDINR